ncbi:MAG: hypothetical protein ACR2OJ_06640 [Hyphomicrobiales bacterium]
MQTLREIADEAIGSINKTLDVPMNKDQEGEIINIIERAVMRGLLEGQHRAVDAALLCPEADQDMAHKIASEIRRKNDLLIANLSSMR